MKEATESKIQSDTEPSSSGIQEATSASHVIRLKKPWDESLEQMAADSAASSYAMVEPELLLSSAQHIQLEGPWDESQDCSAPIYAVVEPELLLSSAQDIQSQAVMMPRPGFSLPSAEQVKNEVTRIWNIMIQHNEVTPDSNIMIQDLLPDCCRVPVTLRHLKEEPYTPKVVSIGPFHHGNERLQDMERHKQILSQRFTQRAGLSRDDLVRFVQPFLVSKVRASYPETIDLTDTPKLIDMILLDAGFIIELFVMSSEYGMKKGGNNDAILIQPWLANSVLFDLLLLENQLPFFFIEDLFNKAFPHPDLCGSPPSFLKLTYEYFSSFNKNQLDPNPDVKIKHFTDLLRLFYLQGNMPKRGKIPNDGSHILKYSANALEEAGVKLRMNCKSTCLLDLKFSGHALEIPKIEVDDNTELLLRNMIALEQCHYPGDAYITDYALLLDWLIDTNKDVDLLIRNEIVRNYLADANSVASLINGLSDNVIQWTFTSDFVKICKSLNDYCENPRHKLKATLRHDYCRTPWQTAASFAAIVLLFLTVVQTVFSILQVVN